MTARKIQKQYEEQLLETEYQVLDHYVNAHTNIVHKHIICGHKWLVAPHRILKAKSCPKCYGNTRKTLETYKNQLLNTEYEVLEPYINRFTKILHKHLVCNYEWGARPHDILNGHGCQECAGKNCNKVYLLYIPDLELYKYGISNNPSRRSKELGYYSEVLEVYELTGHQEARNLEKQLLSEVVLLNTGLLRSGNRETFRAWK